MDQDTALPVQPRDVTKVVADGKHNAFASFVQWQGRYWLAFRQGSGHIARDGNLIVLSSCDAKTWEEAIRFDMGGDDRDAQLVVFAGRLWLYFNSLEDGLFKIYASSSADGQDWDTPQRIYQDGFILWKPVVYNGLLYAGAHRPGVDSHRLAYLLHSTDGLRWEKISSIREGSGESETALSFGPTGKLTAFLRDQTKIGGAVLQAEPPYTHWSQDPAAVHLSGQSVYTFDGVTYLFSRFFASDSPIDADAPRATLPEKIHQGTMVYTYEGGVLAPYCLLGPLAGNHDSSYATAVQEGDEMLVVFHRAAHEFVGDYCATDAADLYLARVPLKKA
jgi:hypothetical protein